MSQPYLQNPYFLLALASLPLLILAFVKGVPERTKYRARQILGILWAMALAWTCVSLLFPAYGKAKTLVAAAILFSVSAIWNGYRAKAAAKAAKPKVPADPDGKAP